jgi:putative peptide zinc metalloprotease protein
MDPAELRGRNQVRIRLRPGLALIPQTERGQTRYVLRDPVSLRYFRLDERQHFLVTILDGTRSLEEVRLEYERRFRPDRLPAEELEAFAAQLLNSGLAVNESPLAGRLLFEQSEKQRLQELRSRLLNFLCVRIPLFDPDRLLARLVPAAGVLFTPAFAVLGLGVALAAAALVATHWADFIARLPGYRELLTWKTLLTFWAAVGLVKILHEFGHGLCCKRQGGECHEMGLLLLLFFPSLYCDVSDSWKLPRRRQRLAVGAAGMYVELLIAGPAAFAWWASDPGTYLNQLCFGLLVVCSVNTVVCNANPLLRLDGYFLLSDWLEVPNLAELSGHTLRAGFLRWLGLDAEPPLPMSARRQLGLAAYAVLSTAYRWLVLAVSLYLLHEFLGPRRLAPLSYLIGAAAAGVLLAGPAWALVRAARHHGGLRHMKPARVGLALAVLLFGAFVVFAVPFPLRVEGVGLIAVEADQVERVGVPECGGFLGKVLVRDGQRVKRGDVLAVLTNPQLEIALRVNEADQGLRRQQQREEVARLAESGRPGVGAEADLGRARFELRALGRQYALLRTQRARLTLRAPRAGVVLGLPSREAVGKWLDGGAELCRVGNATALRAVLLIEPSERGGVEPGKPAWVRVHGGGARRWPAVVRDVAEVEARSIPPQLSHHAGGDVATEQDPVSRQEAPRAQHYLVSVRIDGAGGVLHPGALGRVRITAGSQTLWWRARRYLATTFNWGL